MFRAATSAVNLSKRAAALRQRIDEKNRIDLAHDMGTTLCDPALSDDERLIAMEIVAKLINDQIASVRTAIAKSVASSPYLSAKLAQQLAEDINEVAIPVLKLSPVLEERVLESIIDSGAAEKIHAIAGRAELSANICRRIVASGKKRAVIHLLENPTAQITNHTMVTVVRVYGDDSHVEKAVLNRGELPDDVINDLCELAEAHVISFVQRYFNLPEHVINVQKGRNLLKTIKTNAPASETGNWWEPKKGAV